MSLLFLCLPSTNYHSKVLHRCINIIKLQPLIKPHVVKIKARIGDDYVANQFRFEIKFFGFVVRYSTFLHFLLHFLYFLDFLFLTVRIAIFVYRLVGTKRISRQSSLDCRRNIILSRWVCFGKLSGNFCLICTIK